MSNETAPKERPILFQGAMVRALLAGAKTQTRRAVKGIALEWLGEDGFTPEFVASPENHLCPYGFAGDLLWVRESWMPDPPADGTWAYTAWAGSRIGQIAGVPERFQHPAFCNYAASWLHGKARWTPGIHMPRWASRILLEVTAVRVERLQAISADDAKAEGISEFIGGWWCEEETEPQIAGMTPQEGYRHLWERINGPGSWDANPWVWAVEFRRIV